VRWKGRPAAYPYAAFPFRAGALVHAGVDLLVLDSADCSSTQLELVRKLKTDYPWVDVMSSGVVTLQNVKFFFSLTHRS
jgi:hypothetical protein